jgi:hypothetical protein
MYTRPTVVMEAIMLQTTLSNHGLKIFCTHGHQGDKQSDGNWFSKFFVAKIWAPLQAYLKINPNTPAYDSDLKTLHNRLMYEWSSGQKDLLLITGHTHQPVFGALTHVERLQQKQMLSLYAQNAEWAQALQDEMRWQGTKHQYQSEDYLNIKPTYFNSGCCCFDDGDITGIEISEGNIRLIKWESKKSDSSQRIVLEEMSLEELSKQIQ